MNPEIMQDIQKRLTDIEDSQSRMNKMIAAFKIDKQLFVPIGDKIKPGIGTKVSYDSYGRINGTEELTPSDIPQLSINKISGLMDMLGDKALTADLERLNKNLNSKFDIGKAVRTGCKVNVNENGIVTSLSNLLIEDIPSLPIEKIEGLSSIIDQLRASSSSNNATEEKKRIIPGSGCRIDYDEYGRITGSHELGIDDLPGDIISRINSIEEKMSTVASQKSLSNLSKIVYSKIDSNAPITPGTYTKVTVDSKGLITFGNKLDESDIPDLGIDKVSNLRSILNDKASRSEVITLNESISRLMTSINRIGDVSSIKQSISMKADKESVLQLKSEFNELKTQMNEIVNSVQTDLISLQLESFRTDLNQIIERINLLESKISP